MTVAEETMKKEYWLYQLSLQGCRDRQANYVRLENINDWRFYGIYETKELVEREMVKYSYTMYGKIWKVEEVYNFLGYKPHEDSVLVKGEKIEKVDGNELSGSNGDNGSTNGSTNGSNIGNNDELNDLNDLNDLSAEELDQLNEIYNQDDIDKK